jgi:hypothetical protein
MTAWLIILRLNVLSFADGGNEKGIFTHISTLARGG